MTLYSNNFLLVGIPEGLRNSILQTYKDIAKNYAEHRWEPSELNGGKFSESIYSLIEGNLKGKIPTKPSKPADMLKACRNLEMIPSDPNRLGDRSLRILIPRMLQSLYEIRNNRGVGHVGGDVDPNFLDATAVFSMASWILAEIIRIFHSISTDEAQEIVNNLIERKHPLVWEIEETRRVLDPKMTTADQTLVLLYSKTGWTEEKDLFKWVEYSAANKFRERVLLPLHRSRLVEYDPMLSRIRISPLGNVDVESRILKNFI